MKSWLLLGALTVVLLMITVMVITKRYQIREHFTTVDLDTVKAQRQLLQFSGEQNYNDFGRLQSPNTQVSPDQVDAAIQQVIPVATSRSPSMLTLLGTSLGLGAADDGTGKSGAGVEQTGVVAQKITFCESLPVNCDAFNDPNKMAECGFCHRDGIDSTGKAHRGGMYISADDQIRANEIATAKGKPAEYRPTVGSCKPENFTLMKVNCEAKELKMQCQRAGAVSANNACGQCFGSAPAGATGLLYMGPKPRQYTATLWVSHPGAHSNNGVGLTVTYPNGSVVSLPYSNKVLLDPQQLTLEVTEGDILKITIYGMPMVWCGWLSNASGTRTVSLDVGEQSISPTGGATIAGDKRSKAVTDAAAQYDSDVWSTFQTQVPNTVMWYGRRDEIIPGAIKTAWYGNTVQQSANAQGIDVTDYVKMAAGAGQDIPVGNQYFQQDPAPGIPKHGWVTPDRGDVIIAAEQQTIPAANITNIMQMVFQVPATLVEPIFADDKVDCPSGPIILTEVGAGLMGSHSCYKPDGSFNPTTYCLQELFLAAGGTQQGTAWPATDAKVKALVVNNSLDDTVAALNTQANIALYGTDANGKEVDFKTFQTAAMAMLGRAPRNPCDTANAQKGPQSPECLDYLWRTSGNAADDNFQQTDPSLIPYQYCGSAGSAAPLNADGSVNEANVATANTYGSIPAIRGYYNSIFNRAQNTEDFDDQAQAMQQCFNVKLQKPVEPPSACPLPNPTEWQCYPPEKLTSIFPQAGQYIADNSVPAMREVSGAAQCLSRDGQYCYGFPSVNACQAWVQNPASDPTLNQIAPASAAPVFLITQPNAGRFVYESDTQSVYWNANGTNIVNWVNSCGQCGLNPCGNLQESLPASAFWAKYVRGPDYQCGKSSVVDQYLSARV